jgi:uncharacterized protein (DUF362 family)
MVAEAVDHLGGIRSIVRPGSTVVIKPNAGHEGAPETSINTSPAVVAAVIRAVQRAGPARIILAESSAIGCDTMTCLESSGIRRAAEEAGVDEIRDIKSEEDLVQQPVENPTSAIKQIELPRFLLEADHLVNVPIFKSHVSMVFTCALKNLKGVVQDKHHYVMHCTNLANAMMDLGEVVRPDLTVVDMIRPMEGFGPHSGTPVEMDCVLAGRDMVAIDATACRMVGLPLDKVEYFEAARAKGLGSFDGDRIEIRGAALEDVRRELYLPYLEGFEAWPEYNFHIERALSGAAVLHDVEAEGARPVRRERRHPHHARPAAAAPGGRRAGTRPDPDGRLQPGAQEAHREGRGHLPARARLPTRRARARVGDRGPGQGAGRRHRRHSEASRGGGEDLPPLAGRAERAPEGKSVLGFPSSRRLTGAASGPAGDRAVRGRRRPEHPKAVASLRCDETELLSVCDSSG